MTEHEKTIYDAAVKAFTFEPGSLTEEQITALRRVDPWLGDRAERKCQGAQQRAAVARHRAAMGQPPATVNRDEELADSVVDTIGLALAPQKARIKALETDLAALQQRYRDLETRLLETEAARSAVLDVER